MGCIYHEEGWRLCQKNNGQISTGLKTILIGGYKDKCL